MREPRGSLTAATLSSAGGGWGVGTEGGVFGGGRSNRGPGEGALSGTIGRENGKKRPTGHQ